MGAGTTWTEGLSSDGPGKEKGRRSGPTEHSGSSGPFPRSSETCLGGGVGLVHPSSLPSPAPRGPQGRQLHPGLHTERAPHQGGAEASGAAPFSGTGLFLISSCKGARPLQPLQSPQLWPRADVCTCWYAHLSAPRDQHGSPCDGTPPALIKK